LLCAATLASCGGGNGSMVLSVTITGLTQPGLVLMNGSDKVPVDAGTSLKSFPTLVANDQQFDITFTNPANAKCTLTKGKNKANVYTVTQPVLECVTDTYFLGGKVTGLQPSTDPTLDAVLTLANGPDTVSILATSTPAVPVAFKFPHPVAVGTSFGVTVLAQPKFGNQKCTVDSANVGTMPANDKLDLVVTCK
jgi:hypothetical protein